MNRRQFLRTVRRAWITLGRLATVTFVGWSLIAYRASSAAHAATRSNARVAVHHENGIWSFIPLTPRATTVALAFFPGALVSPVAYAPLMQAVAATGFPAYIVELPRRGAFGGADGEAVEKRFDQLLARSSTPGHWVIGGHSRGAVVASRLTAERRAGFTGLILIGTSHPRDVDLSALTPSVTKIVGTRDGLASPAEVAANRTKLPAETNWVWIAGGNHSQFGWYDSNPVIGAPQFQRRTSARR